MRKKYIMLLCLALIVVTSGAALAVYFVQQTHSTPGSGTSLGTPTVALANIAAPHVEGTQIIDASGHPLVLRGAEFDSSLIYIQGWQKGKRPTNSPLNQIFSAMAHDWKMNVVRVPVSNWIYAKYTSDYTGQLDQVVQAANNAGLYVVFALHDDLHSGSPYKKGDAFPKAEDVPFWKGIATHFRNNPTVMFDLFNEPKDPDWKTWLHGGTTIDGAKTVGFLDLIATVRSAGAPQIVILEPGSAGKSSASGGNASQNGGWATFGDNVNAITDPNVMYSLHVYDNITNSPAQFDTMWGPILHHHPLYYGEWALLPNAQGQAGVAHCKNIPHNNADQIVNAFLGYMTSRGANWTAWRFAPPYLVQNFKSLAPTSLDVPWTCGNTHIVAGMGELVKKYLTSASSS